MSVREGFKSFKVKIKGKARQALGRGNSPSLSTGSPPKVQIALPSTSPGRGSLTIPNGSEDSTRPISVPPSGSQTGLDHNWGCLKSFLQVLSTSSGVCGPLKIVINDLAQCVAMHEDASAARLGRDYDVLKTQLEAVLSELSPHFSGDVSPTLLSVMANFCGAIERELDCIASKEERKAWSHYETKKNLEEVVECYRRIHGHLERLNLNANINTWKTMDELATEARLSALKPSMPARYNSAQATELGRRNCTPKTREQVLRSLSHWRHDQQQGNMFWLNGMAGTGKTTIASTLCEMLDRSRELGASFFCTKLLPECRDAKRILPSIAYQLARFSRPFRFALSRVLEADPDIHTLALSNQLKGLITGPLHEVAHALPNDLVIVVDALDECEDSHGVGQMLELLANHAADLPVKIFVSSRPEPQIRDKIGDMKSQLVLHELDDKIVKDDIETFLRSELAVMSLPESQLATLVERAGVLFIYAATVVRYITAETSQVSREKRLASVLSASVSTSSNRHKNIDLLYSTILDTAFNNPDLEDEDRTRMKFVLDTVICAQEPLTVDALSAFLQLGTADWVHVALRPLWSVLHISNNLVTTLHASFPDYMLDPKRSGKQAIDMTTHHGRLAELSFEHIERNERQFNICELESSYLFDDQIVNLEERVKQAIPLELVYACQYWAFHLDLGGQSAERIQKLESFLSKRLLLWMEVLNLTKRINVGPSLLETARRWCTYVGSSKATESLVHDAWRFVTTFATNPVSHSTPHIYVSMLASWPSSGLLSDCYVKRTRELTQFGGTGMESRELALLGSFAVGYTVHSAAISPDGTRVALVPNDDAIRVWDLHSGRMALELLERYTQSICSVAFSPDGIYIASGSRDMLICIWDLRSGRMVLGPLEGHTDRILSVAFSPDGMRIASGSDDMTIRVWDTQTGMMVVGPLKGHTHWVTLVLFSPDSTRIISGSLDKTIRIWDARSGNMVMGPLTVEGSAYYPPSSIAFSPDGMRIACSSDKIRVWDMQNGRIVLSLPNPAHSVAFSPDGMRIVSGSSAGRICVWDAHSGEMVLGPLEGHITNAKSVAFSPDGMRIISVSGDRTIRVWDSQSERVASERFEGHSKLIWSAVFSPDGTRILSGAANNTACVWDARTGTIVTMLDPLDGSIEVIDSVTFSPDGTLIAYSSQDAKIRVCDLYSGRMALGPLEGHTHTVQSLAFSPNGMRLVSGSWDQTIRVWDLQSKRTVLGPFGGHAYRVTSVAFSPNGMLIASSSLDAEIRVWDAQSGKMVTKLLAGQGSFASVAFSPDSMRIACGSWDRTGKIYIWDVESGKMVLEPFEGHTGPILSIAFSPDGMYIVSGSGDRTIRVWDTQKGNTVLGPFHGHTSFICSTSFSPDGTRIVSSASDDTIRIWRLPNRPFTATPNSSFLDSPSPQVSSAPTTSQPCLLDQPSCGYALPWTLDEDGWVVDEQQRLCLWVPPDLRAFLQWPNNTALMSGLGSVRLRFEGAKIGESWTECYTPYPPA